MNLLNTRSQYGAVSWTLHWIIVLALVAQWLLSEADEDSVPVPGSQLNALTLHQSIGLAVLLLAIVRLAWRFFNPKPAWPADMKSYEVTVARSVHFAFYFLLFAIPLTGWALSSVEDEPLRFFNWFDVPRVALSNEDTLEEIHEILFNILVALAVLHVFGATKHWFVSRRARSSPRTVS
ncbi:cytochrome b [Steroidobacter cummioxidans]|uniref:cytochrome b n=1 Tax=Steroidobacter cummioxidans TaxID=1803913 RepID=UPI001379B015|nr:cytochrome b [Steroidobacter cummioxidans]